MDISPKYQMTLIEKISQTLQAEYTSDTDFFYYIKKWHEDDGLNWENFTIYYQDRSFQSIDLKATLHSMDSEILLKIAIDLGIETPNFIPAIPIFKNEIKSSYKTASQAFEKAYKQVESDPDLAVGLVNSALESIIKEILKDKNLSIQYNPRDTLYVLAKTVLKTFHYTENDNKSPREIKTIGGSLLAVCKAIEELRSDKTFFHGKTSDSYVISDPLYAYLIVNSVATVGLFLISSYKQICASQKQQSNLDIDTDLPF